MVNQSPRNPALEFGPAAGAPGAPIPVHDAMDPRLQRAVALRQAGHARAASTSTGPDEIAVLARVSDVDAWEALSEVRIGARVGGADANGDTIVTARIPMSRVAAVRQAPFVRSLKAGQQLQLALRETTRETLATPDRLPPGSAARGGSGVVVGIVDFGCDFAHRNFRDAKGRTRIEAIWDQTGVATPGSPFGYGRLHERSDIDLALKAGDPYAELGYGPDPDSLFRRGSHGTHVMDIAAGNGRGSGVPGVAPEATLIFVEVASSDIPWSGPEVVGRSFGDSVQLLEAVTFIFERVGTRPCVVNLSLGTNGGPHDGSMLVEEGLDRLVRAAPNRAVVIAAANSWADGIHAAGTVPAGGQQDVVWVVPQSDFTHNELEIWYPGGARLAAELVAPDGTSLGTVPAGANGALRADGQVVVFVANRLRDPNNGDNMIGVFLERGLPSGAWRVRLRGDPQQAAPFHAWIERDDTSPSQFLPPHDNSHTIGSISCGRDTVVVGSYDAHKAARPLSFFSAEGPTRDGRQKPELSAPGHDVMAAHSRTETGVLRKSGTSMAAPAVTGIAALVLDEASRRGLDLDVDAIRSVLAGSARRNPPAGTSWHPRFGEGRISASAALEAVAALAPSPVSGAARGGARRRAGRRKK